MNFRPLTVTVRGQVIEESGVSPARSNASAATTLNVDPGAARPIVASDWPLLPSPFAAATMAPVEGRMATSALAGFVSASVFSASFCSPDVQRCRQRLAGDRLGLEEHNRFGFGSSVTASERGLPEYRSAWRRRAEPGRPACRASGRHSVSVIRTALPGLR